jgi:hypothetical protein
MEVFGPVDFTILLVAAAVCAALFFFAGPWLRWFTLAAGVFCAAVLGLAVSANVEKGCYPWQSS